MKLSEFYTIYKDETACINHLKQERECQGISCKKCGNENHYWLKQKKQWQCKSCSFRTTLRSGTIFESSNLPLFVWYQALFLICNTKKGISACELQQKLGLKRYEPAWYMMHKIRKAMSRITERDHVNGVLELDDTFFVTVDKKSILPAKNLKDKEKQTRKLNILIMIETDLDPSNKYKTKTGRIRMLAAEMIEGDFIWQLADQQKNYAPSSRTKKIQKPHQHAPLVVTTNRSLKVLPWVQTVLGNIKRNIRRIYHNISIKHTQLYLDEFAFKFNHRNEVDKWNLVLKSTLN